jgi:predicted HicB family RNase H-like nuclease
MAAQVNKQSTRKNCSIRMNPKVFRKVRLEALHSKKTMGEWLEGIIEEHTERQNRVESG